MSKKFYVLKQFEILPQKRTKLCWAACLQSLVSYLNKGKTVTGFQQQVAEDYIKTLYRSLNPLKEGEFNVPINEDHIPPVYKKHGISVENCSNELYNFDFYKTELETNELPLLLGVNTRSGVKNMGHLFLVCGYGCCEDKKYILLYDSDCIDNKPFRRIEFDILHGDDKPIRLWSLKVDSALNLNGLEKISTNEIEEIQTRVKVSNFEQRLSLPYFNFSITSFSLGSNANNMEYHLINQDLKTQKEDNSVLCLLPEIPYKKGLIDSIEIDDDRIQNLSQDNASIIDIDSVQVRLIRIDEKYIPLNFSEKFDLNDFSYSRSEIVERIIAKQRSETIIFNS